MQQKPVKRLSGYKQCLVKMKIMLGFHDQVERNWSCACSLSYKQIPPFSTKTIIYMYVCIHVYTDINLVAQESSPGMQQPSWCSGGPPGHRACRMHR